MFFLSYCAKLLQRSKIASGESADLVAKPNYMGKKGKCCLIFTHKKIEHPLHLIPVMSRC